MEIPGTHTLAELQAIAKEQGLVIEEKYGRYRVTSKHSIRDLSITWRVVEAGAGYSLTLKDLHSFLVLYSIQRHALGITGDTMKRTTYTLQEAMDKLGYKSANSFFQLVRKYSEAFVVMKQGPGTQVHYHKATLDRFAERRERFKKEKT